jgi:hypothetical protein
MLARPAAIAVMRVRDRLTTRLIHSNDAARIVARSGLHCERLACGLDRAGAVLATRLRHARPAVTTPTLEHRLAAQRAGDRIGWTRFGGGRAMHALRMAAAARLCEALRAAAIGPDRERCGAYSRI